MFKTEIEVDGIYINGWIKMIDGEYVFKLSECLIDEDTMYTSTGLKEMSDEFDEVNLKLVELNKSLVLTRSFNP